MNQHIDYVSLGQPCFYFILQYIFNVVIFSLCYFALTLSNDWSSEILFNLFFLTKLVHISRVLQNRGWPLFVKKTKQNEEP